jgi:predicted nuclease with TOPRIM domain
MELLSTKKRLQVIQLYFSGISFDQISLKTGVSKGSVTNIVNELKAGNFPEAADLTDQIQTLWDLAVDLEKLKLTVAKPAVGIALLKRTYELNLDPADMERWPLLLNSIKSQDDAQELIDVAYTVRGIQQETGLSLPALEDKVKNLGEKAKELETTTKKIGEVKDDLNDLTKNKKDLTGEVTTLEKQYQWLMPRVQELEKREKTLIDRYESRLVEAEKADEILKTLKLERKKLVKTGLTVPGLVDFNRKLETVAKHHGLKPSAVRERLLRELKYLDKGLGLEMLVKNRQQLLEETNETIENYESDKGSLEEALENLKQQKQGLEATVKEITDFVRLQIEGIVPVAKNTMQQIATDLKNGCAEALSTVYQLKEESIKVGQDMGQYKGILAESEWVKKLMALVHGGDNIDAADIRTIALLVNRTISAWLRQHGETSATIGLLAIYAQTFLIGLEKWQT